MDVVFPPEERDHDDEDDEDIKSAYDKGMAVWNVWRDLWRLLNNNCKVDSDDAGARNKRAGEVQVLVDKYRIACRRAVGSTSGLYVHILSCTSTL
jgi:hypothetical protein